MRLLRPGCTLVLEDPDGIVALHRLRRMPADDRPHLSRSHGVMPAGRNHLGRPRSFGIDGTVRAEVLALPPRHPYLRLPLQLTVGLEPRLLSFVSAEELRRLRRDAENELQEPTRWGTTFTLIQSWGQMAT